MDGLLPPVAEDVTDQGGTALRGGDGAVVPGADEPERTATTPRPRFSITRAA
ncbi:hypothetical protein ACF090_09105 [Streptomyces sp. NPDC014892]|uniref:hypothetical protein n=1 Tax=Streptomyces sp. NPDC014892 TaxID=3364930 RepID=UPI0036F87111